MDSNLLLFISEEGSALEELGRVVVNGFCMVEAEAVLEGEGMGVEGGGMGVEGGGTDGMEGGGTGVEGGGTGGVDGGGTGGRSAIGTGCCQPVGDIASWSVEL